MRYYANNKKSYLMSYVLYIVVSYKLHYVIFVQNTPLFNFKELAFGSPFDAVPTPKQSSLSKKKKKNPNFTIHIRSE